MEVKIYREPENQNMLIDEKEVGEYHSLTKELGLSNSAKPNQTPAVYQYLNSRSERCLRVLCPTSTNVEQYIQTTIPVEVLRVLQNCKKNEMFDGYEVWSDNADPDPLLIGWKYQSEEAREKGYSWQKDRFLIARWGDMAYEFPKLLEMAAEKLAGQLKISLKKNISKLQYQLNNLDDTVEDTLSNGTNELNIRIQTSLT